MALSSLLIVRGLSQIPDVVNVQLVAEEINVDLHGLIHLLATPSQFAAQIWGDESMAILFQHVEGNATPPRELNPDLPESLEAVIIKAMAVDPENRFQTFDEMREALEEVAQNLA